MEANRNTMHNGKKIPSNSSKYSLLTEDIKSLSLKQNDTEIYKEKKTNNHENGKSISIEELVVCICLFLL